MRSIPFVVAMVFIVAGIASILLAGNGLAAIAFACGAIAVYVFAGQESHGDPVPGRPRQRIEPLESERSPDSDLAGLRFRPRQRGVADDSPHLLSDPGMRLVLVVAAVAITLASLLYAARFVADQRDRAQALELAQKLADELHQMGEAAQRDLDRSEAEAASRRREEAVRRDQAMPFYPPPAQVPAGQRACMNGTAVLREPNGWSQVLTASGRPQPCRDRR